MQSIWRRCSFPVLCAKSAQNFDCHGVLVSAKLFCADKQQQQSIGFGIAHVYCIRMHLGNVTEKSD